MTSARRTLLLTALLTIAADIGSKAWASARLEQPVEIGGSLSLRLAHNPGVAFGVGQSLPSWTLLLLTGVLCAGIAVAGWRGALFPPLAVGLILGGAIGNLLDRLTEGSVVDMIHLTWWPTFNLADVAICVGAALAVVFSLLPERPTDRTETEPA